MQAGKWDRIRAAKELLHLGDRATLQQIKAAYRRLSKRCHPDTRDADGQKGVAMQEVNAAYEILIDYCHSYSFPLIPGTEDMSLNAEEWWLDRFGQDPIWGRRKEGDE